MTDADAGSASVSAPDGGPPPDGAVTTRPVVVGIGASAGGLVALKRFFATVPADSGLAFVVVVHLAPDHESYLADLVQPLSAIPITQLTEETTIEANRAYVIPPGRSLSAVDSHLRLAPMGARGAGRGPIDHFFRTLAQTHDGASVGVILSGSGSDGSKGIQYVREQGGLTIAQDPNEAEFGAMPRNAMDTGFVDHVLPIDSMVQRIREFAQTRPDVAHAYAGEESGTDDTATADALLSALTLVRVRTGHDFLRYKRSTVTRRIARRMQMLNISRMADYLERLRADEREAHLLIDDLLINVTSFFRDPGVFGVIERDVIPELFEGKGRGDSVRVWSVGCATGQEPYSLGMLLLEAADRHAQGPQIQVFATDLHEGSIMKAREALYGEAIEAEVSQGRLERFFRREPGGYRVTKVLRDVVTFATHNLLRDPPFSRQNLIVCRNMLIYLQRDMQDHVMEVFHYALAPGGRLLLGTAETLDRSDLFRLESRESHLYRRRDVQRSAARLSLLAAPPVPPSARPPSAADAPPTAPPQTEMSYAAIHQRMAERYAPPSLLVGPAHEVVHFSDRVGLFLQHPSGQPTHDLFKLVREEFRMELRTALHMVRERHAPWQSRPIVSSFDGRARPVVLHASPATDPALEGFALVVFDEAREAPPPPAPGEKDDNGRERENELEATRSRMQAIIEEFEASQEEMRASNEELQSANEELRSTLEELETSREELQSVNEELQTINQENRHKVEELSQLSGDLQNLLQSTDIATVFLDRNLRILRYTPRMADIFSVRHTDRGRPLADITHRLQYPELIRDARRVLQTLVPLVREVDAADGTTSYQLRAAPYRTVDDRIEGMVITMVDITALKRAQAALHSSREGQALLVRLNDETRPMTDPLEVQRVAAGLLAGHLGATRVLYAEMEGQRAVIRAGHANGGDGLPVDTPLPEFEERFRALYGRGKTLVVDDVQLEDRFTPKQRELYATASVGALIAVMLERDGRWAAGLTVHNAVARHWTEDDIALIRDVTARVTIALDRARAENVLKASEEQYRHIVDGARDYAILTTDLDGRILSWSPGAEKVLGWSEAEALGQPIAMTFTPKDREQRVPEQEFGEAIANGFAPDVRWHLRKDGAHVFIDGMTRALTIGGEVTKVLKVGQDVTERRRMEQALQELNESLERRVRERTDELQAAGRAARDRDVAFRRRLTQAEEGERRRLSRDLHDQAGQLLTALGLGLKAVSDLASGDSELGRRTERLRELADTLGRELHAVAVRLRPKALDDFGLEAALQTYAEEWARISGIELSVHAPPATPRLPEPVETAVYRIVQEALTNVARHSGAKRASVLVERRDGTVVAAIEDDGRGLDPAVIDDSSAAAGVGLRGIRERAALLGGTAEVESTRGAGTTVFIKIPVTDDPAA